jgi:hypothetical protein
MSDVMSETAAPMRPRRRRPLLVIVLVLAAAFGLVEYLNFSGFCWSERRYFSDRELIDRAILFDLKALEDTDYIKDRKRYGSLDEFYAANPDCCRLVRGEHHLRAEADWRWLGGYTAVAEVFYRLRDAGPRQFFYRYSLVSACGSVGDRMGHEQSTKPPKQSD